MSVNVNKRWVLFESADELMGQGVSPRYLSLSAYAEASHLANIKHFAKWLFRRAVRCFVLGFLGAGRQLLA